MLRVSRAQGLRIAISAATLAIVLLTSIALLAMTEPGRWLAARGLEWSASQPGQRVTIGRISGSLFSSGRIEQLAISDDHGTWLMVSGAEFDWRPWSLLSGHLDIRFLSVSSVDMLRVPSPSVGSTSNSRSGLPLTGFDLGRLKIDKLRLEAVIAGEPMTLAVGGAASVGSRPGWKAQLGVRRIDGAGGHADLAVSYQPGSQQLRCLATAAEPVGGVVARLLGFGDRTALGLKLDGTGPVDDWHATMRLVANGTPFIAATAAMRREGNARAIEARLAGYLRRLLPHRYADLAQGKLVATARAMWHDRGIVDVGALQIESESSRAALSGSIDIRRSVISGRLDAELGRSDGRAVTLQLADTTPISFTAGQVRGSLGDGEGARPFDAAIALQNVTTADERVRPLIGSTLHFIAQGDLSGSASVDLAVGQAKLTTDAGVIAARGTIGSQAFKGTIRVDVPKLKVASALARRRLSGAATIELDGRIGLDAQSAVLNVRGQLRDAAFGLEHLDRLVSGPADFSGKISHTSGGTTIEAVEIRADKFSAKLDGSIKGERLSLATQVELRDLAAIEPALAGKAHLQASINGTAASAATSLVVEGPRLSFNAAQIASLQATFQGRGPIDAQKGGLKINARIDDRPLTATAAVSGVGGNIVGIERLDASFGRSRIAGRNLTLAARDVTGDIEIVLPDFSEFSRLAGMHLSGAARGTARFVRDEKGIASGPTLRIAIGADAVAIGQHKLGKLGVDATVTDVLGSVAFNARAVAERVTVEDIVLPKVEFTAQAEGPETTFAISAAINDIGIKSSGALLSSPRGTDIRLKRLRAQGRGKTLALASPIILRLAEGTLTVPKLSIVSGGGRITIEGSVGRQINLDTSIADLPVGLIGWIVPAVDIDGTMTGAIAVRGASSNPVVDYRLSWNGASSAALLEAGLAPVAVSASGRLEGQRAGISGRISGADGLALAVNGSAPTTADGVLNLALRGAVPLQLANVLLRDHGSRITGRLTLDGSLRGTLAAPSLAGTLMIRDGTFSHAVSGIRLIALNAGARADGNRITIERLSARAPNGGELSGGGTVVVDPRASIPAELWLKASRLHFETRQQTSGWLDADLVLRGDLASQATLTGNARLGRVFVQVPERLPASYAALDLEHRNLPPHLASLAAKPAAPNAQQAPARGPIIVELGIRVAADNSIHVRGRGIDARLGGAVNLSGTSDAPRVDGRYVLDRGRVSLLGRRLEFTRGQLEFTGSTTPNLDLEAYSQVGNMQIAVTLSGSADAPKFAFSSTPQLPEDEVLARFLFNNELAKLSPVQMAQLASEVDKLGGLSSGPSLTDRLRGTAGIDVLDVGADKKGNAEVTAGRYLGNNMYVGVTQGTAPSSSRMVIDLDVTRNIKARGEVGVDGATKIGIGVEWDY